MKHHQKLLWVSLITGLVMLTTACMNNSGGSGSSSDDSSSGTKVGLNPDLTAIHSQNLQVNASNEAISLAVIGTLGTMQITNISDSNVTVHNWPVIYDDTAFTLISNKTIVLSPGLYDFSFLVTINNHQYAGSANAVTVNDGDQVDIPLTVNAVIGDTNISVAVVAELPKFKFSYPAAELSGLTAPKIGITIDGGTETILDLNTSTGISNQYVNLSAGSHTIELQLYDGNTQVGRSIDAQESVTVVAGNDIPLDLVPLSGLTAMTLTAVGGDAVFNFTVPNEVINEAGGAGNIDTIFKMSGTANNPTDVTLSTLVDDGNGTSTTSHTHTGMQAENVNVSLEFFDNTNNELLGSCTITGVTLDVNGSSVVCGINLVRRAVIQGNILATIGVNVFDIDYNPVAGAVVSENGNTLGLTDTSAFGTAGFLTFNLQTGTYTILADDGTMQGTATITVNPLDITNISIILDTPAVPAVVEGFAYVSNTVSSTFSVIDLSTNTVINTVAATATGELSFSSDGNTAYINSTGNNVLVVDTASNAVISTIPIPGISHPYGSSITPDSNFLYVTDSNLDNVNVISTDSLSIVATIPVGTFPLGLNITPDGNFAYVANKFSNEVSVIDTSVNMVTATITVGSPWGIAITPDGNFVYIAGGNSVSVVDTLNNTVVDTITVGSNCYGIAVSPNGNFVYVANNASSNVSVINTANNSVVSTIPIGSSPGQITFSQEGSYAYVTHWSGIVSVINTFSRSVVETIPVGNGAGGIAIKP